MKKTQKRNALLMSALSLLLCVSMLVGTTFAWFTDEVTSGMNTIAAGNLDIELLADGVKVESGTKLFADVALWEPGVVVYENLQIANVGSLALKYQMSLNFGKENALNGHKLSEVLQIAVVDKIPQGADRAAVLASVQNATSLEDFSIAGTLAAGAKTEEKAVVIFWAPGENDNWYNANNGQKTSDEQPLSIEFGVKLLATQLMSEDDSFGKDYDKDAWVDGFDVFTAQDLQAAINNGETAIDLMADIEAAESIVIPEGATVALNLNGKNLGYKDGYAIESKGDLTISGEGDITGMGGIRATAGKLTINSGNYYGASDWSKGTFQHAIKAENATVVINGGDFDATVNGQTNAMLNASANATITINGGNFKNVEGELPQFAPYIATYEKNGMIVINDGTFYGGWRFNGETSSTEINGGTFTVGFDGQSFHANSTHKVNVFGGTFVSAANAKLTDKVKSGEIVAAGYKAVDNGNGTWTVVFPQESFDSLIDNANPGETVNVPAGNFTMSGNNDIVIVGSGEDTVINFTNSIENVNISNATVIGEPRLAVKSGQSAVFNNVSFEGTKAWGSVQGTAEFVGCTFTGLFHIDSSAATTTIKFTDCTFDAYSVIKLGGSAKYILEDCTVEALAADATGAWGKEWLITYCDTTFTNCELGRVVRAGKTINIVMNGCVDAEGKAVDANIVHKNASPNVLIDGVPVVFSAEALKAALETDATNIEVVLGTDISVDIGTGWKMGGVNTETINIDGNGKVLTLSSNYRSYFNMANENGVLNLKNMTLTNLHTGAHFFDYTTHFNCDVVAEDVIFAKSPLVTGGVKAVFTNCEFSQAGTDIYGLWIMSGSDVTVKGGELKTDRGFKIADEDSAKEKTALKVTDTKFNNTKKAAILVTTNYGADITLSNVDITNCGADSTNAVWVDDGRAATADTIVVNGGTKIIEP